METTGKYMDYEKKDVLGKVPEDLWYAWLERASEEDKGDEVFMKKLVVRRGECLRFAPDSLRADRDIVLKAAKSCPSAFLYASDELRSDRKLTKQAVNLNSGVIQYVKDAFRNDKGIGLLAVRKDGGNIAFLSEELQNDIDVIEASLGGNLYHLRYASEKVRGNREIAIKALSRYGSVLEYLPERLRADKAVVTAAVGSAWNALEYASEDLRGDRDVILAAVRHDGYALQFASDKLKDDKEIVLTAIEKYEGDVLEYASERLRDDKETVLSAVGRCEYSIGYASERLRHDKDVIYAVLEAHPGQFENLPEDVQENLDYILFGLESVVRHLPDPEEYSFFDDAPSEYYTDFEQSEDDFLDILESMPREALREDPALNDRVCRLALQIHDAYYKEGNYPCEAVHDRLIGRVEALFEENDVPLRPILKEAIRALDAESEEKDEAKYGHLDPEERLFYENLDRYERIVGSSVRKYGPEEERDYLSPGGGFVGNCMLSFVKDLVYAQPGLCHDSGPWDDDDYEVDLDKAYEEIRARLSPKIRVVRNACESFYSENITVDVTGDIHLILVRAVPLRIMQIWVNKVDSEHEHGKRLAPDRLSEFCGMVEHISEICGRYEKTAQQRAAELRDRFGL